jgi:catechol 2,3-dioxygenase-like lactoylglutathione lyase family enzyme
VVADWGEPFSDGSRDSVSARVTIHTITVECMDASAAARFWRDFLGYAVKANHTTSVHLTDPDGIGPDLLFAWADRAKVGKNRIHLDLRPDDQDVAVQRALTLGATLADIGQSGRESWIVLHDPAGNEFCLLQTMDDLGDWEEATGPPSAPNLDT